jgi:hypothetical protein
LLDEQILNIDAVLNLFKDASYQSFWLRREVANVLGAPIPCAAACEI